MEKIKIKFVYPDQTIKEVEAIVGQSILQVAHKHEIPLEGACEGSLACSTCHVYVDNQNFCCQLKKKSEQEEDMLDLAYAVKTNSRLGCQIIIEKSMDGYIFHIPKDSRNFSC